MKLFASDLDGTLLNEKHKADDIINQGIQQIYDSGNIFTVCTGRNLSLTKNAGLVPSYIICMNGASILDKEGRVLACHPLSKETIRFLLWDTPFRFEYQTMDTIYTTGDEKTFTKIYRENQILRHRDIQKDMEKNLKKYSFNCDPHFILEQDIYKVNLHYTDDAMRDAIDTFAKKHADKIINAPSTTSLAEITGAGITKANAVEELGKILGIQESDIYVYGDGINDISMLQRFKHSYCPKNGSWQAKQAARYLLDDFETYSVIRHMQGVISV